MRDTRHDIINFWFVETEPTLWFQENEQFDAIIRENFLATYTMAKDGLCDSWNNDVDGCLALCLLLNQFPRNMFRGAAQAYATDSKALIVSKHALAKGFDHLLTPERRRFLYLPFVHSEKLNDQRKSVELFGSMKKEDPLSFEHAQRSLSIIEKFSRFPRRNIVLGRDSTPEEQEYLAAPTSR